MTTTQVVGERDSMNVLKKASEFFVDAWWTDKVGGMFKPRQRESLERSQFMDFRGRYAGSSKSSVGGLPEAELILCQTQDAGILGCAGLEITDIPMQIPGQAVQEQETTRVPVMSNVAVSRHFRRKGIAELLVSEIERVAFEWGYDNCYLYVDKENVPAVKLYQKLGYRKVWVDTDGKTQFPTANGNFQSKPTTIVCMKKALGRGIFGRITWPF
jgi:GNAT superfamily N-acetyltransferase